MFVRRSEWRRGLCGLAADDFPRLTKIIRKSRCGRKPRRRPRGFERSVNSSASLPQRRFVESAVQSGDLIVDDPTTMPATRAATRVRFVSIGCTAGWCLEATSTLVSMAGISDATHRIRPTVTRCSDEIGWRPLYDLGFLNEES